MQITAYKIKPMLPPKDSLIEKIKRSSLRLREGDVVVISSKVVSIDEGRTIPLGTINKDELVALEADYFLPRDSSNARKVMHTITRNFLIASAGIDESNGNGWYTLYPKRPNASAERLLKKLKKTYGIKKLAVIISDSHSVPLRRGIVGFALGYAGFYPLYDYRGKKDLFGRLLKFSQVNIADAVASAAVLVMGEGDEGTPIAVVRNAPHVFSKTRKGKTFTSFEVSSKDDLFGIFITNAPWQKGGSAKGAPELPTKKAVRVRGGFLPRSLSKIPRMEGNKRLQ